MTAYRLAFAGVLLLVSISVARADILIDPIYNNLGGQNMAFFAPNGQSFTADASDITWIGMFIGTCNYGGMGYTPMGFELDVFNGAGTDGTLVSSATTLAPWGLLDFLYFDFTGTDLVVGNTYTAVISQIIPMPYYPYGTPLYLEQDDVYSGGMAFWGNFLTGGPGVPHPEADFYLRVLSTEAIPPISPSPTPGPEPSMGLLVALALMVAIKFGGGGKISESGRSQ